MVLTCISSGGRLQRISSLFSEGLQDEPVTVFNNNNNNNNNSILLQIIQMGMS